MDLFIIRHAWAEDRDDRTYPDDAQRPLTAEGQKRFAQMADRLVPRALKPRLIATSPMVRCVQTAEILAAAVGAKAKVVPCDELLPGGDPKHLLVWTEEQADGLEEVAWVGHAPDVGHLAALLIGQQDHWMNFKKGAIAAIRLGEKPDFDRGELQWFVTAKVVGV
jgi:phosphohistidine phosphatase